MKLFEVIDTDRIRKAKGAFSSENTFNRKDGKSRLVGSGVSAHVYSSNRGIGDTVTKVHKLDIVGDQIVHDPYLRYIQLVTKNQNNPYFPRIRHAKIIQNNEGEHYLVVQMEKLVPITSKKTYDLATHLLRNRGIMRKDDPEEGDHDIALFNLEDEDERQLLVRRAKRAGDQNLVQAIQVLTPLFRQYEADMHTGNVMIRLGPAPHIVLTDPFVPLTPRYLPRPFY